MIFRNRKIDSDFSRGFLLYLLFIILIIFMTYHYCYLSEGFASVVATSYLIIQLNEPVVKNKRVEADLTF